MANTQPDNEALVLYPARIALATNNVISDPLPPAGVPVQGVPLAIFKEVLRNTGTLAAAVQVLVDPPLDPGQYLEMTLWVNGVQSGAPQPVGNQIIIFYLFQSELLDGLINIIQYKLKTHAGNISESIPLWALYSKTLPGGNNVPGTDEHPGLDISLPAALGDPASIGKEEVEQGVRATLTYPYMKAYDNPIVEIGTERFDFIVGPGEVGGSFVALIDREKFELVGSLDNCPVSYTTRDQLGNTTHKRRWSKIILANIYLDLPILPAAILREILSDSDDKPEEIDLVKLAGNDLSVVISTVSSHFKPGDTIEAECIAKREGLADIVEQLSGTVEVDEFGEKKRCILKMANANVILADSVAVTYKLLRTKGDLVGKSRTATAKVVGTFLKLKPPSVLQANDTTLDPMKALSQLTIVVPQGALLGSDLLSVCWIAKPGTHPEGSITTPPRPISEIGLNIDIPPSVLAFCLGDSVGVLVSYIITRDGIPLPSETLPLTVLDLPQTELSAPRLNQAADAGEGSELRLSDLTPDGKMWCPGFPLIAVGQFVWLCFKGTNADGSVYEQCVWSAPFAFVNDDWVNNGYFEATAPHADLKGLEDGTPLTMEMRVAFGKSEDLALAKRFVARIYIVSAVEDVPPSITSVKGPSSDVEIPQGGFTVETAVSLSGDAAKGQKVEIFDRADSKGDALVDAKGKWTRIITGLSTTAHSIYVKGLYEPGDSSEKRAFTILPVNFTEGFEQYPKGPFTTLETTYMTITATTDPTFVQINGSNPYLYLGCKNNVISSATLNLRVPCSRVEFIYSVFTGNSINGILTVTYFGNGPTPLKTMVIPAPMTSNTRINFEEPNIKQIVLKVSNSGTAIHNGVHVYIDDIMLTAQT